MGGGVSKARVGVDSVIKGSVTAMMESDVKASINVACDNEQIVKNAHGCDISFADQLCTAVGISNFTGTSELTADVAQTVMNDISAKTESLTSGLMLGFSKSDSSTMVKSMVDMSMDVTQSFRTDCTRNISAINTQAVDGCSAGSVIRFAKQDISAKVIGDCVSSTVGKFSAAQDITQKIDASASATTKGVDMFGMFLIILAVGFCLIIVGPLGKAMGGMVMGGQNNGMNAETQSQSTRKLIMLAAIAFIFINTFVFWWPGVGSMIMQITPYDTVFDATEPPYDPNNPGAGVSMCQDGRNINPDTFINKFMWYDPLCLSSPDKACTNDVKEKHYESCGIFASKFGCDDPQFKVDKQKYSDILDICSTMSLIMQPPKYCDSRYIATQLFSTEPTSYDSCKKCTEGDALGMWVNKDGVCSFGSNLSMRDYMRIPDSAPCSPDDPYCKDTEELLKKTSPDDCMHTAYQTTKMKLSKAMAVCDKLDKTAAVRTETNEGKLPLFKQQCPPQAEDYLKKCNSSTGECNYTARSTNQFVIASCKNDLMGCCETNSDGVVVCQDRILQNDIAIYNNANRNCADKWALAHKNDYLNPYAAIATVAFYGFLILLAVYITLSAPAPMRSGMYNAFTGGPAAAGLPKSNKIKIRLLLLCLVVYIGTGIPFGVASLADGGSGFPMSVYPKTATTYVLGEDQTTLDALWFKLIIVAGVMAAMVFILASWIAYNKWGPGSSAIRVVTVAPPNQQVIVSQPTLDAKVAFE